MLDIDAVALMRSFAGAIDQDTFKNVDLRSDADHHTMFLAQTAAINDMISHIQRVTGARRNTRARQLTEPGRADPALLSMLQDNLLKSMRYTVSLGEDQHALKHMVVKAMKKISDMDDASLLTYADHTKLELVHEYVRLSLRTICLHTTASCSQTLHDEMSEVGGLAGSSGASLLQAGLRPIVQLLMKAFGLPEHPKETQAERSAAINALLKDQA